MKLDLTKCGLLGSLPVLLLMSACVDDQYDLSDIDTTSRLSVNDLVIPANIDPITLGDIIKIDEDSKVQMINVNGEEYYALIENGSFESEGVSVKTVNAVPTPISPTRDPISRLIGNQSPVRKAPSGEFVYEIKNIGNEFSYQAANIDKAIVSIDAFKTKPFDFTLDLVVEDNANAIKSMSFQDLKIAAPKGLTATTSVGEYDAETGYWTIAQVDIVGNKASITLSATGINAKTAGISILSDRSLDFKSQFIIESGYVEIVPNSPLADEVILQVNYGLSNFDVTAFSGQIEYDVQGINIDPISLAELPKFLTGDETNIIISNPQIYLQLNNPVAQVPLDVTTGLTLSAVRWGEETLDFSLNNPLKLGTGVSSTTPQNFVLSPSDKNLATPSTFESGLKWQQFSTLGSLLATPSDWSKRGLPNQIKVNLVDPSIPTQTVTDFELPASFPAVNGKYEIIAPLALNDGSYIYYTDTRTGWNDEDVDAITVTTLEVTAHAVNNVPADIQLYVYPIDKNGNVIDAKIESNLIPALSSTNLVIKMTGEIRHLDGIRIEALIESDGSGKTLSDSQTLDLTNVKAKVTGYYDKKF